MKKIVSMEGNPNMQPDKLHLVINIFVWMCILAVAVWVGLKLPTIVSIFGNVFGGK